MSNTYIQTEFDLGDIRLLAATRIYFNLHKRKLSVQQKQADKGWRVVGHADQVVLIQAKFKVSEAGRQRVLRESKKNVHAYVEGYLQEIDGDADTRDTIPVRYNPYIMKTFETLAGTVVSDANKVVVGGCNDGYYILKS